LACVTVQYTYIHTYIAFHRSHKLVR
jgi:hypothetical protein